MKLWLDSLYYPLMPEKERLARIEAQRDPLMEAIDRKERMEEKQIEHLRNATKHYTDALKSFKRYKQGMKRLDRMHHIDTTHGAGLMLKCQTSNFRSAHDRQIKNAYEEAILSACFEQPARYYPKFHSPAGRLMTKLEGIMSPEDILRAKKSAKKRWEHSYERRWKEDGASYKGAFDEPAFAPAFEDWTQPFPDD